MSIDEHARSGGSPVAPRQPDASSSSGAAAPMSAGTPGWAAGHVIAAVVLALALGALFNAGALLATAERQEFGATRTITVAAAERLLALSQALRLDRPRAGIDQALGRTDPAVGPDAPALDDEVEPDPGVELDEAPRPGDETLAGPFTVQDRRLAELDRTPEQRAADEAAAAEAAATNRAVTPDDPLTIYIGGDSMVGQFGTALEDLAGDTGVITTTEIRYEFGSGLSRPDFIDWPEVMAGVTAEIDPELIVLYFGGNDAQALDLGGTVYQPEDAEWQVEYRTRVNALMTQLQDAGHAVYWMGMPIPRSDTLDARYRMLNEIYESEADGHDAVTFIPAWDLFAGPDGSFSEFLPNAGGDMVDMRLNDGIHYTTAGAYRIARVAADRIIEDYDIPPAS